MSAAGDLLKRLLESEPLYHVVQNWDGDDLLSSHQQYGDDAYRRFTDKWSDAGDLAQYHAHQVHLYKDLKDAEDHQKYWGGEILQVHPDEDLPVEYDDLEFRHPVVRNRIPKHYVSKLDNESQSPREQYL